MEKDILISSRKEMLMGKRVFVVVEKSKVFFPTKDIQIKGDFFIMENNIDKVSFNKDNILYVTTNKESGVCKVGYKISTAVLGDVIYMDSIFITIRVHHVKFDKYYNYVFPLKGIKGLKLMEFYDKVEESELNVLEELKSFT